MVYPRLVISCGCDHSAGTLGPTRGLEAAGRSVADIFWSYDYFPILNLDVFCVFLCDTPLAFGLALILAGLASSFFVLTSFF